MPTSAPTVIPRTTATPAVPPPTTREPLPHAISDSRRTNSLRYWRSAMGTAMIARTKNTIMWPSRMTGADAFLYSRIHGASSGGRNVDAVTSQPHPGKQHDVELADCHVDDHQHQDRLDHGR